MRSIAIQNLKKRSCLNSGSLFNISTWLLFQEATLVVVLKQTTAGTNRRSYAIHLDEWIVEMTSNNAIRFIHDHTSEHLTFVTGDTITLNDVPGFHLESITCVDSRMNPQLIYTAGSNKILVGNKVDIPFELQNTN